MTTPDASSTTSSTTPAPDSPLMSLYRQALGPVGVGRNIRVFSVFEATGRTRPGWNWVAAFLTLHWMVFYRLWRPAALYAFLAVVLLGLFWMVDAATMPTLASVRWWLLLAFAVVGTVLPGLYGDALLYAQTELRVHNAIAESLNLAQARTLLARRAGTARRIGWQALGHMLLLVMGGVAAIVGMAPTQQPQLTSKVPEPTMATPMPSPPAPILPLNAPPTTAAIGSAPPALPLPPATPIATVQQPPAPVTPAATPVQAAPASKATAAPPAPPPERTSATVDGMAAAEPATRRPAKVAVKPVETPSAPPVKAQAKVYSSRDASQPVAPTPVVPVPEVPRSPSPPGKVPAKVAVQAKPDAGATSPADKTTGRFFIHAGTFSLASNAEKVHARIEMAGLPATLQNFTNADKDLIRVRVGPFGSRAEADRAAAKLRSMRLDAMIYGR
ncbi:MULTISPECIES: SPOR domain-containing protein [Giesbergeria]|uniref:SPOR domain-containing protein n=1 Tax=Giesbergeria sinuosa TaxID=80883 RepID=A0ABV9QHS0_9BURK